MSKRTKPDTDILAILDDYHLFIDSDKQVDMPFYVNEFDKNHVTSLKGEADLNSTVPLGNTVLECVMKEKNEFKYSFNVLTDAVKTRMLFRMDEGDGAHWNRHLQVPVDQQQVPTPHFHKVGDDGIMFAYSTDDLKTYPTPLNIHDGFEAFCKECHINQDDIQLTIYEEGTLPLEYAPEPDPLIGIQFP